MRNRCARECVGGQWDLETDMPEASQFGGGQRGGATLPTCQPSTWGALIYIFLYLHRMYSLENLMKPKLPPCHSLDQLMPYPTASPSIKSHPNSLLPVGLHTLAQSSAEPQGTSTRDRQGQIYQRAQGHRHGGVC